MKNTEAILVKPKKMRIQEAPVPKPKENEILLKVEYVGICGSDVHGFEFGPYIAPKDPMQKIGLGHECAGVVVAVGKEVTEFKPGDRVCIEPGVPCGKCSYCLEGRYHICPDVDFMATQPNYRGALTNYLCHPESFTYHLPDSMSTLEGALIEPAAVGMHAALEGGARLGKRIVILGAGCIGLMTLQACRCLGAVNITVVDMIEKRLDMAKQLGAAQVINASACNSVEACAQITGSLGADIVFETAGSAVTARQALSIVGRGGRIMIVGTISGEVPIDFLKINREVSIQTSFRYANNYPMTIEAVRSGRFDVKSMVTHIYNYHDVQKAFDDSIACKNDIIKAAIKINDPE